LAKTRKDFSNESEYLEYRKMMNEKSKEYHEKNRMQVNKKRMERYYGNHQEELKKAKKYNDSHKKEHAQYYQKNRINIRIKAKKFYDEHPELMSEQKRKQYHKSPEKYKGKALQRYQTVVKKFKEIVMSYYSKKNTECRLCKEKGLDFLNIDHIEGRKEVGHSREVKGAKLYHFLIKHNFPEGYQVLCWNCNNIKKIREPKKLSQTIKDIKSREREADRKIKVMTYYSKGKPKCKCCKYSKSLDGLTIDHIEGRKNVKHSKKLGGGKLYYWLIQNKFPSEFQVLCFNCNSAKSDKGKCPHKLKTT
jgi:hypothetical protein